MFTLPLVNNSTYALDFLNLYHDSSHYIEPAEPRDWNTVLQAILESRLCFTYEKARIYDDCEFFHLIAAIRQNKTFKINIEGYDFEFPGFLFVDEFEEQEYRKTLNQHKSTQNVFRYIMSMVRRSQLLIFRKQ